MIENSEAGKIIHQLRGSVCVFNGFGNIVKNWLKDNKDAPLKDVQDIHDSCTNVKATADKVTKLLLELEKILERKS